MCVCVSFSVLNILGKSTGTAEAFVAARFDLLFFLKLKKGVLDGQDGSHPHNPTTWEAKAGGLPRICGHPGPTT